jgi:hypothetical protein
MSAAVVRAHMEPQWFLPLFVIMWLVITGVLSRLGGWASLATQFRSSQPADGERFRFVSGSMGKRAFPVSYGGCLFVVVSQRGFALSILFPFRFQSPPLFIPWAQVESVEEKRLLFVSYVVVRLREQWPLISLRGRAGRRIKEVYESLPSTRAL